MTSLSLTRRARRTAGPAQGGQAAVETAIVLPLMVFLLLGSIQMNLAYQARMVAEYAAYSAARAGAMNNASKTSMRNAALAVLTPTISNPMGGIASVAKSATASDYLQKYMIASLLGGRYVAAPMMNIVDVRVCNPSTALITNSDLLANRELDFDDPAKSSLVTAGSRTQSSVDKLRRGRLSIQLRYNYNMPIPFANWVIWQIQNGSRLVSTLRLQKQSLLPAIPTIDNYYITGMMGQYMMPIVVDYSMRMQSNLFVRSSDDDYKLPTQHGGDCQSYRSGS